MQSDVHVHYTAFDIPYSPDCHFDQLSDAQHILRKPFLFLAHLAQSAKVSFWDDPLSVVRRRRRASSVVRRQQFT